MCLCGWKWVYLQALLLHSACGWRRGNGAVFCLWSQLTADGSVSV